MALRHSAGDHRRRRERDFPREAHRLLGKRADNALLPCGPQRMYEYRGAEPPHGREERIEARVADRDAQRVAGEAGIEVTLDAAAHAFEDHEVRIGARGVQVVRHAAQVD